MSIFIEKKTKNFYNIFLKKNDNLKLIKKYIKNIYIPFGLEEYKHKLIINIELEKQNEFNEFIKLLQNHINELFIKKELVNVFKIRKNKKLLYRLNIKNIKRTINSKIYYNNNEISIYALDKKINANVEIEISGIWVHKNTFGIYINLLKLFY